ncbi:MAG TPA: HDIG domain-containing protein [Dehalococcoidia bacterium]|nr:HDIG domain-containing protein [Dehalococcoidia bacterium]
MAGSIKARQTIPPLRSLVFAAALSVALIFVLFPILPGEAPLNAGDIAYKTFEAHGEVIVAKGKIVSSANLSEIKGAGLLDNRLQGQDVAAAVIFGILGGAALGLYLHLFQPREANTLPRLVLVGLLVVLWVAGAKVFLSLTLPDQDRLFLGYMLPVAAAPMLIATLLDGGLAVAVAGLLAVLATFAGFYLQDARSPLASEPLDAFRMGTAFFLGSLTGIFSVHRAERVNRYLMAGASVALVTFAVLLAFWLLLPDRQGVDLVWMIVASALGGVGAAIITVGATVVLGYMFGVTTRMQLMELAQISHPLLRQLQEKAPGTFHHSVIVGNLGERAADLCGADPLLVRVGCYFHDIGKVAKPSYYIENQLQGDNPHDRLAPAASAKLVIEHVQLGQEMARRYRLPARVRAFIPEHHGTRLVTYFFRKASAEDPTVPAEKFRYPGPRPQSKEAAIVMLADSVEAVVRSSRDRSPDKIDSLVDGVIAERVAEGQMDDCDLTLRDLRVIGESFKATLRGVYHPRIEYPAPTAAELQATGAGPGAFLKPPPGPMDGTAPPVGTG